MKVLSKTSNLILKNKENLSNKQAFKFKEIDAVNLVNAKSLGLKGKF